MKTNTSKNASIFRDQPLSALDQPAPLYVACRDQADPFDAFLRGLLVFCMMGALALLGLETSAPARMAPAPRTASTTAPAAIRAVTAAVETAPAAQVCTHI